MCQLHGENTYNNKKLYFPLESTGLRYDNQSFVNNIDIKAPNFHQ